VNRSRLQIHPPKEIADSIAKLHHCKGNLPTSISDTIPRTNQRKLPNVGFNGADIKAAREAKGWTQAKLAKKVGRSKMWISLIERDKRNITPEDAAKIHQNLQL
jgi:ribosome-binding protein aMBF1 (putative translation factor)